MDDPQTPDTCWPDSENIRVVAVVDHVRQRVYGITRSDDQAAAWWQEIAAAHPDAAVPATQTVDLVGVDDVVARVRAQVAEEIAQAIEAVLDEARPSHSVALIKAARIARSHATPPATTREDTHR